MRVYDRKKKIYTEEKEPGERTMKFLYNTLPGRVVLRLVAARPYFSRIRARYRKSPKSIKDIEPFIKEHGIDMDAFEKKEYKSFNDFFIRKKKSLGLCGENELPAVADSKLSVYPISEGLELKIKRSVYTLHELVGGRTDLSDFGGGVCLVFRLSAFDCHRYIFPDSGEYAGRYKIKGMLHTVRPISEKYRVYCRNSREVSLLSTENLGNAVMIEVGAVLVGCIKNRGIERFGRLEEKGYFEYGGSTVILLLKNNVKIDADILENSEKGIETKVEMGERIGEIIDKGA